MEIPTTLDRGVAPRAGGEVHGRPGDDARVGLTGEVEAAGKGSGEGPLWWSDESLGLKPDAAVHFVDTEPRIGVQPHLADLSRSFDVRRVLSSEHPTTVFCETSLPTLDIPADWKVYGGE